MSDGPTGQDGRMRFSQIGPDLACFDERLVVPRDDTAVLEVKFATCHMFEWCEGANWKRDRDNFGRTTRHVSRRWLRRNEDIQQFPNRVLGVFCSSLLFGKFSMVVVRL